MQERHLNRETYFNELSQTTREYYLDYIRQVREIRPGDRILEVGCGEGGNLLPFAEAGCWTVGVDIAEWKIGEAERLFSKYGAKGRFIASDFFSLNDLDGNFDLIICHDVIEHIADKESFLGEMKKYLKAGGAVFMAFPAWQMPFGGHQQMCSSKILSRLPFIHLLPAGLYRKLLERGGEAVFALFLQGEPLGGLVDGRVVKIRPNSGTMRSDTFHNLARTSINFVVAIALVICRCSLQIQTQDINAVLFCIPEERIRFVVFIELTFRSDVVVGKGCFKSQSLSLCLRRRSLQQVVLLGTCSCQCDNCGAI